VSKTKQADGEIHEDQLLNFLVNRLDEETSMRSRRRLRRRDLCLYALCVEPELTRWEHGPLPSWTKFEPERLERVANTLLRSDPMNCFEQVEVCADLHLRPYYGDEDDTDGLYHSVAKRGTTAFHAYATHSTRV